MMSNAKTGAEAYYTVVIPYVGPRYRTEWHPSSPEGAFSKLVRGCFLTMDAAIEWARDHLNGTPYEVVQVPAQHFGRRAEGGTNG